MPAMTIRMPSATRRLLSATATRCGMSQSEVVRRCLRWYARQPARVVPRGDTPPTTRGDSQPVSLDVAPWMVTGLSGRDVVAILHVRLPDVLAVPTPPPYVPQARAGIDYVLQEAEA